MTRRLRAFDDDIGKILWKQIVGGTVWSNTISYVVKGKQYSCDMTGDTHFAGVTPEFKVPRRQNAIYVLTLPLTDFTHVLLALDDWEAQAPDVRDR